MSKYRRPKNIPRLNLENLPDYVSSSEEEADDEAEQNNPKHG